VGIGVNHDILAGFGVLPAASGVNIEVDL